MRLVIFIFLFLIPLAPAAPTNDAPRYEIAKFRFRHHKHKDFERLVIEFKVKGKVESAPVVRIDSGASGKEANIQVDQANLVGAIPEAMINDSYVPKSDFMGPISINTDGPTTGFGIRTFLKEPVSVDAFWLDHPARLVLDVFPADSTRTAGRVPDPEPKPRKLASLSSSKHGKEWKEADPNQIVCYPVSSAVSAQVNFSPRAPSSQEYSAVELVAPNGQPKAKGPEPVVCFLASAQVVATVAFKNKLHDGTGYTQWDGSFDRSTASTASPNPLLGGPSLFGSSNFPTAPAAPAAPGTPATPAAPLPVATGPKPPGLVVPDVTPGRTPLGAPLQAPGAANRLPAAGGGAPSLSLGAPPPKPATNSLGLGSLGPPTK